MLAIVAYWVAETVAMALMDRETRDQYRAAREARRLAKAEASGSATR